MRYSAQLHSNIGEELLRQSSVIEAYVAVAVYSWKGQTLACTLHVLLPKFEILTSFKVTSLVLKRSNVLVGAAAIMSEANELRAAD